MRARTKKVVMETTKNIISKELKKQMGQILEVARQDFKRLEENKKERLLRCKGDRSAYHVLCKRKLSFQPVMKSWSNRIFCIY